ncbi:hypothetical protein N7490_006811 [Penicillium lividum]|nr:hypothetical protein N7490_006811 [Penicillium lividum]
MASDENTYQSTWWRYRKVSIESLIDTKPTLIDQDDDLEPDLQLEYEDHKSVETYPPLIGYSDSGEKYGGGPL